MGLLDNLFFSKENVKDIESTHSKKKTTNSKERNDMWSFKKKFNLGEEIDRVHEIVSSKIHSKRVAKQFILEELDAASQGDDKAKMLVSQSGFSSNEYKGAMRKSFEEVDGSQGPQQALLRECMSFEDKNVMVEVRVSVIEKIINKFRNDYYKNDEGDNINVNFSSKEQEVITKLLKIKALKDQEEAIKLFSIIKDKNGFVENLPNIVAGSILQAQKLKKLIEGDDHSNIRNTIFFLKEDAIINLLETLSEHSVTELSVGMLFQDKKYWNDLRETLEEISHPMFLLALDSVADNLYFILIGLAHEKQMNDKDLYEEIFKK